jgi:hypothetical protein
MDWQKELIGLFSENSVEQVEANGGQLLENALGADRYQTLLKSDDFEKRYTLVHESKKDVEHIAGQHQDNTDEQVTECLRLIMDAKKNATAESVDVLRQLINKTLYTYDWETHQRQLYDKKYRIIVEWKDYFMSYTNRNAAETNRDFKRLIQDVYLAAPPMEQRLEESFLAKIIVKYLEANDLEGFFDHEDIRCGDDIEEEVRSYCGAVYTFVQLIEYQSFSRPATRRNWCCEEYNEFNNSTNSLSKVCDEEFGGRHFFIITEKKGELELLKPADLHPHYNSWFDHVRRLHCVGLRDMKSRDLRLKVWEIAKDIVEIREKIVSRILGD